MTERTVLVLSGGGALGAYQCGAYRAMVKHMDSDALRAMVIVGASIGAVNGFLMASHMQDPDSGVDALERFWRNVSLPSVPFLPMPDPRSQRLNAVLTGMAFGNPAILPGIPGGLLGGLYSYPHSASYTNTPLVRMVGGFAKEYDTNNTAGPRLMIRAIDIAEAAPVWFDSAQDTIVPSMIGASSAIPLLFKPAWHDSRAYWDGDIWHQGIAAPRLRRITRDEEAGHYHVVTVELFKRTTQQKLSIGAGSYLDHLRRMFMGARSDEDIDNMLGWQKGLRVTRIQRNPHPYEEDSAYLLDWSPERIEYLLAQGEADAERAFSP